MFCCDKCGLCCRHIEKALVETGLDRGDGVCKYLDEKVHLCKIYYERPIFCNVDKFFDEYLMSEYSREKYYTENYELCRQLKERYGE